MSFFQTAPEPPTKLGRYRVLSPSAGIHVSPLCLGGMSLGGTWSLAMGKMDHESSFKLLDAYYDAGGNFIDTANLYQAEESENIIGEWMEKRDIRDQIVVATKYTFNYKSDEKIKQKISYVGNNAKSLYISVEASLKKLRTAYIDILYVHMWDFDTSIEEVMNSLHHLVAQRKVLYLGISDTPAWVVAKANTYARLTGKTPFSIYQGAWSIMQRAFERDIIPMAREEGMALAPFSVVASGRLRSDAEERKREETGEKGRADFQPDWKRTEEERKMSAALEQVGNEIGGASISAVAIAYVMHKAPYVFPIVGSRKVEQLEENIKALSIVLSSDQIKFLESVLPFDPGFPHHIIGDGSSSSRTVFNNSAHLDRVSVAKPFLPSAK